MWSNSEFVKHYCKANFKTTLHRHQISYTEKKNHDTVYMYCLVLNVNAGIARGAACKFMLALRKIVIVLYGTDLYMYVYVLKGPGFFVCF